MPRFNLKDTVIVILNLLFSFAIQIYGGREGLRTKLVKEANQSGLMFRLSSIKKEGDWKSPRSKDKVATREKQKKTVPSRDSNPHLQLRRLLLYLYHSGYNFNFYGVCSCAKNKNKRLIFEIHSTS